MMNHYKQYLQILRSITITICIMSCVNANTHPYLHSHHPRQLQASIDIPHAGLQIYAKSNHQYLNGNGRELTQQSPIKIFIQYSTFLPDNTTKVQNVTVYANNQLNFTFVLAYSIFDCSNLNLFLLNLTQANSLYSIIFSNFTTSFFVYIFPLYNNAPGPAPFNYTCNSTNSTICIIIIDINCTSDYSANIIETIVTDLNGETITKFEYNTVCNNEMYGYIYQIQWGIGIVVLLSIIIIFASSKFQRAQSYNNIVFHVNYVIVGLFLLAVIAKFVVILEDVPNILVVFQFMCLAGSVVFGILGCMVCFSEFVYWTGIGFFRIGYTRGKLKFRIMQVFGIIFGIGMLCAWYFTDLNWIISNIIFTFIYFSFVKIIKFGSLKITILIFVCTGIIDLIFYGTLEQIDNSYQNQRFNFFNNPLFLMVPLIAHIPNRECSWYFILSMAYPGIFLSYLERFDKNRSSKVYGLTFIISYTICSFVWFGVSIVVPFALPYTIFAYPLALVLLTLFANRRGELSYLWHGSFYDEQRQQFETQQQMLQRFKIEQEVQYNKEMFNNLRYGDNSSETNTRSKNHSYLTQLSRRFFPRKYTLQQQKQKQKQKQQNNIQNSYNEKITDKSIYRNTYRNKSTIPVSNNKYEMNVICIKELSVKQQNKEDNENNNVDSRNANSIVNKQT